MKASNKLKYRINAGRVAIKKQIEFFHKHFAHNQKDPFDGGGCIAFADFAISEKIFAELRKSFVDDIYFSEESNSIDELFELNAPYSWILNSIDGKKNYASGIPACAISLILLREGYPIYTYVYDMLRQKIIEGGPKKGLIGNSPRRIPKFNILGENSRIGIEFPLSEEVSKKLQPLFTKCQLLDMGSSVLNSTYVATGIFDGCFGFDVKAWNLLVAYSLCLSGGIEFHFIGDSVFPLKQINFEKLNVKYFAGTSAFCSYVAGLYKIPIRNKIIPASLDGIIG